MKFPRHAKILRSHFDVAPFAAVFFVLVIFLMLGALLPTAGIPLEPPSAADLPGVAGPTVAMAVDRQGQLYFENQIVTESQLTNRLVAAVSNTSGSLTLVIHADQTVPYKTLAHWTLLARDCGITNALLATLPSAAAQP